MKSQHFFQSSFRIRFLPVRRLHAQTHAYVLHLWSELKSDSHHWVVSPQSSVLLFSVSLSHTHTHAHTHTSTAIGHTQHRPRVEINVTSSPHPQQKKIQFSFTFIPETNVTVKEDTTTRDRPTLFVCVCVCCGEILNSFKVMYCCLYLQSYCRPRWCCSCLFTTCFWPILPPSLRLSSRLFSPAPVLPFFLFIFLFSRSSILSFPPFSSCLLIAFRSHPSIIPHLLWSNGFCLSWAYLS